MGTDDAFELALRALRGSVRSGGYSRKVQALLMPDDAAERARHAASARAGEPCPCRACYFAKGRRREELLVLAGD